LDAFGTIVSLSSAFSLPLSLKGRLVQTAMKANKIYVPKDFDRIPGPPKSPARSQSREAIGANKGPLAHFSVAAKRHPTFRASRAARKVPLERLGEVLRLHRAFPLPMSCSTFFQTSAEALSFLEAVSFTHQELAVHHSHFYAWCEFVKLGI
jgi:hypothetical protein